MDPFAPLARLSRGDRVAVISPSAGLPGLFPWVHDLGLRRLREVFELEPVEYPTTRLMGASLADRARDVMAAFADPEVKAVFTSIGGIDEIRLLPLLDTAVLAANPKPFFGYSDNTQLHVLLSSLGMRSFYGGAVMTQLGFQGGVLPLTESGLRAALFEGGEREVVAAREFNDIGLDWADPANLDRPRVFEPAEGLSWDGCGVTGTASGRLWGGCVESLVAQFAAGRWLPDADSIQGVVLFLETSEEIPPPWVIDYVLNGMGVRGWFDRLAAVLVGRPKAWEFDQPRDPAQRAAYRAEQREQVLRTVRHYHPTIPVVQSLDIGHTDPQVIVPYGSTARLDTASRRLWFEY